VEQFNLLLLCLGIIVTQTNEYQIEIHQRINMGNKYVHVLHNLLSSKVLLKHKNSVKHDDYTTNSHVWITILVTEKNRRQNTYL